MAVCSFHLPYPAPVILYKYSEWGGFAVDVKEGVDGRFTPQEGKMAVCSFHLPYPAPVILYKDC
ncbi:hypothetical protein [Methermicoccus shengliensis]|uniref:hypothetical protein n=1 Tax=Methermicoccus shengliensis TaxID=660064 RepID=UPI0012F6CE27|nr:hypothetical protein [Methermicoccus shengliensis]